MAVNIPARKIHIIGAPGSGKTYLGHKLAKILDVPLQDLDEVVWANETGIYGVKRTEDERNQKLMSILSEPAWIIEGVYHTWLQESFAQCDMIVLIKPNCFLRNYRLITRFIKRRLGFLPSKNETLKTLKDIIIWGEHYHTRTIPLILELTEQYADKRLVFSNADQAYDFIAKQYDPISV